MGSHTMDVDAMAVEGMDAGATDGHLMDPRQAALAAGLRYAEDAEPGLTRRRRGRGFSYHHPKGGAVADADTLERVRSLAIPPAWSDVWISPCADLHLQATGRDEAGRKQYIYHSRFVEARDAVKYARLPCFASALPRLRRRVRRDLRRDAHDRVRMTAAAVRLMDLTLIRVGNPAAAKASGSYGATTLRRKHVRVDGDEIDLRFVGKSGERHVRTLVDEELAAVVRDCQELPGYELFRYVTDDDQVHVIDSRDVNEYIQAVTGEGVSAKDFRTWGGTVACATSLHRLASAGGDEARSDTRRTRELVSAVRDAAAVLGNTPAVCRASYVHPAIVKAHLDGTFADLFDEALSRARAARTRELRLPEAATLGFLSAA